MNEQDLIIKNKIEKREKLDTILAYVLIVILLGCIVLVLYLKFVREEDKVEEYVPNYINLNEISSSLNSSTLANRYMNDAASFSSGVSGELLSVTYVKDDINVNLNIPVVGGELVINVPMDNSHIVTDIYKEIASIICVYYGNQESFCRSTLDNMSSDGIDGIRVVNTEDTSTVYINTTRSYPVSNEIMYNNVTKVDINETNYVLNLNDIKVSNINVLNSEDGIKFGGNVERLTDDNKDVSVVVKLYDDKDKKIGENKFEFDKDNVLEVNGVFEVSFIPSKSLKLENVRSYSIDIVK